MMLMSKASITSLSSTNTTSSNESNKTKSLKKQTNLSPNANQVVIINQTNSGYLNQELFSSMSSSSSSSLGPMPNQPDSIELIDDQLSDVKYMKGYVNVIKERFARRSLCEKNAEQQQQMTNNQGVIRLSINDYQKRKQMTSNTNVVNNKMRTASVDYQRRRSVSPFTSTTSNYLPRVPLSSNSESIEKHLMFKNKKYDDLNDHKSLHSLSSSSPSQSSASSSPLSSNYSSPTNGSNDEFKLKTSSLQKTEIIKCTYSNEINKDELPKPNFVSSVKNLFEKQITDDKQASKSRQRQSMIEYAAQNSPARSTKQKAPMKKSVSIESLVDRLKQNGTLVYEHNEKENAEPSTILQNLEYMQSELNEPLSPVLLNNFKASDNDTISPGKLDQIDSVKSLSFKERKEMFSKNNTSMKLNNKVNNINNSTSNLNKRQKIDLQVDANSKLTDESSDFINDDDSLTSSSSSMNKLDESKQQDDLPDESTMTANDVLNSANNQKSKKSKTPVKVITFYGGEEIKDVKMLNLQPLTKAILNKDAVGFEFIGAGIKLEKSNLAVSPSHKRNRKRLDNNGSTLRVNFTDIAETYEYPSYEFMLKELGIDPLTDPDYQIEISTECHYTNGFNSFLPGRSFASPELEDEIDPTTKEDNNVNSFNKLGSFTNFKPSWHNMNYELGSMESFVEQQSGSNKHNSPLRLNTKNMNSDSFIINDILPSKDDQIKRWSSEMDSNILF